MPFKTILAIIQSTEDAERVSDCAGALAARYEAHLIGLHAEALPIPYTSTIGFPDAEFIQASTEINQERSKKIEAIFRKRTADAGVTAEWRSLESFSGDSAHSGIASARSCDLVVAAQAGSEDGASPDVDALALRCRPAGAGHPARRSLPRLVPSRDRRLERQPRGCARSFRRPALHPRGREHRDPAHRPTGEPWLPSRPGPTSRRPSSGTAPASPSTPRRRAGWQPTTSSATALLRPAPISSCSAPTAIPGCANSSSAG